jgi:hypothetical protein
VYEQKYKQGTDIEIDLRGKPDGMYIFKLATEYGIHIRKAMLTGSNQ